MDLLEVFVLVPEPNAPVVLRLDRKASIGQVKAALERKRGWPASQQTLKLEAGHEANDAHTLMSLRLHKQSCPTLIVELAMPWPKRLRSASAGALFVAAEAPNDTAPDEQAAVDVQRAVRGRIARKRCSEQFLRLALREACARTEIRCALRIQRLWRQAQELRDEAQVEHEDRAARKIQGAHRTRQHAISPQRHQAQWLLVAEAEAESQQSFHDASGQGSLLEQQPNAPIDSELAPAKADIEEKVIGVVEKETGFRSFGSWQLVTWNRRFMYTTPGALCYRHVTPGSQMPRGKTTAIAFSTIQRVGVHADEPTVLLLECASRQYFFRFQSAAQCEHYAAIFTVAAAQCT